eukprot:Hpha_TRINITY_DN35967_c0_g1::TRINITY_DN35967_c0_g1_i1::g.184910::m.184910
MGELRQDAVVRKARQRAQAFLPSTARVFVHMHIVTIILTSLFKAASVADWWGCAVPEFLVFGLYAAKGVSYGVKRPNARERDNFYNVASATLIALSACARGVAYASGDNAGFDVSGYALLVATILLAIKVILDVLSEVWLFCSKRRNYLQQLWWQHLIAVRTESTAIADPNPDSEVRELSPGSTPPNLNQALLTGQEETDGIGMGTPDNLSTTLTMVKVRSVSRPPGAHEGWRRILSGKPREHSKDDSFNVPALSGTFSLNEGGRGGHRDPASTLSTFQRVQPLQGLNSLRALSASGDEEEESGVSRRFKSVRRNPLESVLIGSPRG